MLLNLVSTLISLTSLSLWWCWEKTDGEIAVLSSIRTQNWVTHTTSLSSCFPLCCLCLPQTLVLLFSAIPSRLFSPFFHPSGGRVCFYSHLSVNAARWASHRFLSSMQSPSAPLLTPFSSPPPSPPPPGTYLVTVSPCIYKNMTHFHTHTILQLKSSTVFKR